MDFISTKINYKNSLVNGIKFVSKYNSNILFKCIIKYYNDGLYYIINEKDEYCCLILNEEITNTLQIILIILIYQLNGYLKIQMILKLYKKIIYLNYYGDYMILINLIIN